MFENDNFLSKKRKGIFGLSMGKALESSSE
jgi:hypothetical protein